MTKRPVTARNPLLVVLLILSPRRVAISLEESPCCAPNRDKFYSRVAISLAGVGTKGDKKESRCTN